MMDAGQKLDANVGRKYCLQKKNEVCIIIIITLQYAFTYPAQAFVTVNTTVVFIWMHSELKGLNDAKTIECCHFLTGNINK